MQKRVHGDDLSPLCEIKAVSLVKGGVDCLVFPLSWDVLYQRSSGVRPGLNEELLYPLR